MLQFLNPLYWFTILPPEVGGALGSLVFALFIGFFILGIIGRIVAYHRTEDRYIREIGRRVGGLLVTMGLLGLVLFFFSFENVQLFGARFWYPVWGLITLLWAFWIFRFVKRDVPEMRSRDIERKERNKYIPNSNKKNRKKR